MNVVVVKKDLKNNLYTTLNATDEKIDFLGDFLLHNVFDIGNKIKKQIQDEGYYSPNYTEVTISDGQAKFFELYGDQPNFLFSMPYNKFISLLGLWEGAFKKRPNEITIFMDDDYNFIFELEGKWLIDISQENRVKYNRHIRF